MGQYAKIVEDLKTQLNECKTKITSLEEENSALKNQVELDDQQRANATTMQQNHNHEEMELLKAQLAELEVIWPIFWANWIWEHFFLFSYQTSPSTIKAGGKLNKPFCFEVLTNYLLSKHFWRSILIFLHQHFDKICLLICVILFNSFFVLQERQKNYDGLLKRIEDFEAKERLEKLEANISKLSPQPTIQEVETKTEEPAPKYDAETQANIDNYLQVLSRYVNEWVTNSDSPK